VILRAQRPQFCALSNEKMRQAGVVMPTWQDAVARYARAVSQSREV
jgi:dTDP-4-dehydrorhamnose reductase